MHGVNLRNGEFPSFHQIQTSSASLPNKTCRLSALQIPSNSIDGHCQLANIVTIEPPMDMLLSFPFLLHGRGLTLRELWGRLTHISPAAEHPTSLTRLGVQPEGGATPFRSRGGFDLHVRLPFPPEGRTRGIDPCPTTADPPPIGADWIASGLG